MAYNLFIFLTTNKSPPSDFILYSDNGIYYIGIKAIMKLQKYHLFVKQHMTIFHQEKKDMIYYMEIFYISRIWRYFLILMVYFIAVDNTVPSL